MASLKKSLFIGIGGTGANAVLQTKKRFIDAYGEIPPMIGFLVIDTDVETQNKRIFDNLNKDVKLEGSEFIYSEVRDARGPYKAQKDGLFNWVPPENVKFLDKMTHGAGQIRSNGRFALFFNYKNIYDAVYNKLTEILSIDHIDNDKFQQHGTDVEINFAFSIGGGTGCGSFIDIAYIVKDAISKFPNQMKTIAFMVMPDVFNAMSSGISMLNVRPNAYGALADLDYLMHLDMDKTPLSIHYENKTIRIDGAPFDLVFSINNKNLSGYTINHINDISELIGLGMFTGASELSGGSKSAYDNVEKPLAAGVLDVDNKKAWVCGMGLSELYYNGNKLGNIYARKAIKSITTKLITSDSNQDVVVDDFIDNPEVELRENNDKDFVIDSLLASQPRIPFGYINVIEQIDSEIDVYLSTVAKQSKDGVQESYDFKLKKVLSEYDKFIKNNFNSDSGVGNVIEILKYLKKQLSIFQGEMESEIENYRETSQSFESKRIQEVIEIKEMNSKFVVFGKGKKISDFKENIIIIVSEEARIYNEILRREWAVKLFRKLIQIIKEHEHVFENFSQKLEIIGDNSMSEAASIQNNSNEKQKIFLYELHKKDINNIKVNEATVKVEEFINDLPFDNKLFDIVDFKEKQIEEYLWKHAKVLDESLKIRNKSIDEVINEMPLDELEILVDKLVTKSEPLWSYDFKGLKLNPLMHKSFVIGVPNEGKSRIKNENILQNILGPNINVDYNNTNSIDRIVFFRLESATPVFAVNDVLGYEQDYKDSNINHHIDASWKLRMDRDNYMIMPKQEDPKEKYAAWVGGFIYEYVKNEDGLYKVHSLVHGDPIDDYWISLGEYRDDAFKEFSRLGITDELMLEIDKKIEEMGSSENGRLISEVKGAGKYLGKFSQIFLSNEDLKKKGFESIRKLISEEISFVTNDLGK